MMIPIRCFSCGRPIAQSWESFKERVAHGDNPKDVMDDLGLDRYCCRAQFLGHIDLIDEVAKFKRG